MIQYTADALLTMRRSDVTLPRAARKAIFKYRLWRPARQRRRQGIPLSRGWSSRILSTSTSTNRDQLFADRMEERFCTSRPAATRSTDNCLKPIPVIVNNNRSNRPTSERKAASPRVRVLHAVNVSRYVSSTLLHAHAVTNTTTSSPPTLYLLNAAAITKPDAIEHLTADLLGYKVDIAIITETHLKKKHADQCFDIHGYSMFRRDRIGRRGGVVVYVNNQLRATVCTTFPTGDPQYELLWVRIHVNSRDIVVGAIYHPPKPVYQPTAILNHIEACMDILAGESVILAAEISIL